MTEGPAGGSLADRLQHLLEATTTPGQKPLTTRELAQKVSEAGWPRSHTYIARLLNGQNSNPTVDDLKALATVFGVPPAYFLDAETTAAVNRDLKLLHALRDGGVRVIALGARGLSPDSQATVLEIIKRVRLLEGLAADPAPPPPADDTDA